MPTSLWQTGYVESYWSMSKPTGKTYKRGPIKYSMPDRPTKTEPLVDTRKVKPKQYKPNRVKLGIKHGESRFPQEAVAPNKRKYNEKGEYIRHKNESEPKIKGSKEPGSIKISKEMALSNPNKRKKLSVKY